MRIQNKQLKEFLDDSNLIEKGKLADAYEEAEQKKMQLGDLILQKKLIGESELRKLYAYILGIPYVDLTKEIIAADVLQMIPEPDGQSWPHG